MADEEGNAEQPADEGKKKKGLKGNLVPALIIGASILIGPRLASNATTNQAASNEQATGSADGSHDEDDDSASPETSDTGTNHEPAAGASDDADTGDTTDATATDHGDTTAPAHGSSDAHWAYEGALGPDHWGDLSADFAACADGTRQSPIDLRDPIPTGLTDIVFEYLPMDAEVLNNGHTIQADFEAGSGILLDGQRFELVQFHLHAPSEHTLAGKRYPMELHLVHKNAEGALAVVGVFFEEGAENGALAPFIDAMPAEALAEHLTSRPIELAGLLPAEQVVVRYTGSLTTPPCSEGVRWNVMTTPVEASREQITAFQELYKGNNRPLQPVENRTVLVDADPQG